MQFQSIILSFVLSSAVSAMNMNMPGMDMNMPMPTTTTSAAGSMGTMVMSVADEKMCMEMMMLTELVNEANNATALAAATLNDPTKIAEIKAKASQASITLSSMTMSSTLKAECAAMELSMKQAMASGTATATGARATMSGMPNGVSFSDARFGVVLSVALVVVGSLVL